VKEETVKNVYCRLALVAALLPLIAGGCATPDGANAEAAKPVANAPQAAAAPQAVKPLPPPSAQETQFGIQIAHVSLTAAGGLVDVRFKVLDAVKARQLMGNAAHPPMLVAGDNPPLMPPHNALKGARFAPGQIFYILYPNARSAIKPGVAVTVAMGEVRLGPVTVE
jgi:hypothetical protein